MEKYEFALVGNELYNFVWNDFCSWYIELAKSNLNDSNANIKGATQATLYFVLIGIIKMLSPFMPFVMEELYQALPNTKKSINLETWPNLVENIKEQEEVEQLISIIKTIRELKVENNLKPSFPLEIMVQDNNNEIINVSDQIKNILNKMVKCTLVDSIDEEKTIRPIYNGFISVASNTLCNVEEELAKFNKEKIKLEAEIKRSTNMLSNEKFLAKAPAEKVAEEQRKLVNYQNQYNLVCNRLKELENK